MYGSAQSGLAAEKAGEYNRQTAYENARWLEEEKPIVSENARNERRRLAETYHAAVGEFRAQVASAGFDPNFGSAKWLQEDALKAYRADRKTLARNEVKELRDKDVEIYNLKRQGFVMRQEGSNAKRAGALQGATTLLSTVSTISRMLPSGGGTTTTTGTG